MVVSKEKNANTNKCLVWLWISAAVAFAFAALNLKSLMSGMSLIKAGNAILYVAPFVFLGACIILKKHRSGVLSLLMLLMSVYGIFICGYKIANEGLSFIYKPNVLFLDSGMLLFYIGVFFAYIYFITLNEKRRKTANTLVWISVVLFVVSAVLYACLEIIENGITVKGITGIITDVISNLFIGPFFFTTVLSSPAKFQKFFMGFPKYVKKNRSVFEYPQTDIEFKMRSVPKTMFLMIITLGFYNLYFIYQITDAIRYYKNDDGRRPGVCLALAVFVPFYSLYWYSRMAEHINDACERNGVSALKLTETSAFFITLFLMPLTAGIFTAKVNLLIEADMARRGISLAKRKSVALRELSPARFVRYYILTLGIYGLYFLFSANLFIEAANREEESSAKKELLLAMFVPFYRIAYESRTAFRIELLGDDWGMEEHIYSKVAALSVFGLNLFSTYIMKKRLSAIQAMNYANANVELEQHVYATPLGFINRKELKRACVGEERINTTKRAAVVMAGLLLVAGFVTGFIKQMSIYNKALDYLNNAQYYLAAATVENGANEWNARKINEMLDNSFEAMVKEYTAQKDGLNMVKTADWMKNIDDAKAKEVRYTGIGFLAQSGLAQDAFNQYLILTDNGKQPYRDEKTIVYEAIHDKIKEHIKAGEVESAKAFAAKVAVYPEFADFTDIVDKYEQFLIVYNGWDWGAAEQRLEQVSDKSIFEKERDTITLARAMRGTYTYSFDSTRPTRIKVKVDLSLTLGSDGTFTFDNVYVRSNIANPKETDYVITNLAYGNWKAQGDSLTLKVDGEEFCTLEIYVMNGLTITVNEEFLSLFTAADSKYLEELNKVPFIRS